MLKDEIAGRIKSAEVRPFDNLVFKANTVYLKELPRQEKGGGFLTTLEMTVITDNKEGYLFKRLEQEIGYHGTYGRYFIQLIKYFPEDNYLALDKIWARKVTLTIFWEEAN